MICPRCHANEPVESKQAIRCGKCSTWLAFPARKRLERDILAECLRWLGSRPWAIVWRNNTGDFVTPDGRRIVSAGLPGSPDLIGFLSPIAPDTRAAFVGVECKTRTGRLREQQKAFRGAAERRGALYLVARSLDDLQAQLAALGYADAAPGGMDDAGGDAAALGEVGAPQGLEVRPAQRQNRPAGRVVDRAAGPPRDRPRVGREG